MQRPEPHAWLADEFVHAGQMLFRFGRLKEPTYAWVIRGVDVNATDVRPVFEDVNGSRHEPVIDLRL